MTRHVPPPHGAMPLMVEFRPAMRTLIEDAIEILLLLLDEIDGDADEEEGGNLEPNGDELDGPDDNGIADLDARDEMIFDARNLSLFERHCPQPFAPKRAPRRRT